MEVERGEPRTRGRRAEVRDRRSEVGDQGAKQKVEIRGQRTEDGKQESGKEKAETNLNGSGSSGVPEGQI
jgi:hypothetical protein